MMLLKILGENIHLKSDLRSYLSPVSGSNIKFGGKASKQ